METNSEPLLVSDVWLRAWERQRSRMVSCPRETQLLAKNAQISQANYVMALAVEAAKAKSV